MCLGISRNSRETDRVCATFTDPISFKRVSHVGKIESIVFQSEAAYPVPDLGESFSGYILHRSRFQIYGRCQELGFDLPTKDIWKAISSCDSIPFSFPVIIHQSTVLIHHDLAVILVEREDTCAFDCDRRDVQVHASVADPTSPYKPQMHNRHSSIACNETA
jgi:hypothetical protein